jgi:hypothetical protein
MGELDGERLDGIMRGGLLLLRGVCGSDGDVEESEELEVEAERRRE